MKKKTRTQNLKLSISRVIDNKLILVDSELALNTLIGIKISLIKYKDSRISHQKSVESIFSKLSTRIFQIQELDRLRLKRIILPRLEDTLLSWDSASRNVSFWDALELLEADLTYLLSEELNRYLPAPCAAARNEVLVNIYRTRLHPKFGRGSKVSYDQYQELAQVTAGGWMEHLAVLDASAPSEPLYELGELHGRRGTLETEDDCAAAEIELPQINDHESKGKIWVND